MNGSSEEVEWLTGRYPDPDMTAAEFEEYVLETLRSAMGDVDELTVNLLEKVAGTDGDFTLDGTVRFKVAGLSFVVAVEAKKHKNPIKREVVQVLKSKMDSIGAHKGIVFATAPFQKGALEFAQTHGIALVKVTEGRFTLSLASADQYDPYSISRERARDEYGVPFFSSHTWPGGTETVMVAPDAPDYVAELLLGAPSKD